MLIPEKAQGSGASGGLKLPSFRQAPRSLPAGLGWKDGNQCPACQTSPARQRGVSQGPGRARECPGVRGPVLGAGGRCSRGEEQREKERERNQGKEREYGRREIAPGDGSEGQGGLACCSLWGRKESE